MRKNISLVSLYKNTLITYPVASLREIYAICIHQDPPGSIVQMLGALGRKVKATYTNFIKRFRTFVKPTPLRTINCVYAVVIPPETK